MISSGLFKKKVGPRCFETSVKSPMKLHKSHQNDHLNFHSCESFESQMEHTFQIRAVSVLLFIQWVIS
jgi:hypothetical protein